jgi:hypothetical protein
MAVRESKPVQRMTRGIEKNRYRNGFEGGRSWAAVKYDYQQQYGPAAFARYCAEISGVA